MGKRLLYLIYCSSRQARRPDSQSQKSERPHHVDLVNKVDPLRNEALSGRNASKLAFIVRTCIRDGEDVPP